MRKNIISQNVWIVGNGFRKLFPSLLYFRKLLLRKDNLPSVPQWLSENRSLGHLKVFLLTMICRRPKKRRKRLL